MVMRKTHEDFVNEIERKYHGEFKVLGKYKNNRTKVLVKHNCDKCNYHEWEITPTNLLRRGGCPVCSSRIIKLNINTIWDTDRWMVDLGVSEDDAKKYSHGSGQRIMVKCPDCGREKEIVISTIYIYKSIGCSCGDGKSYPEKFIISVLDQLKVDFEMEYAPSWNNNKRYDFYLKDIQVIIEAHGGQHFLTNNNFSTCGGRDIKQEQNNDRHKKEIALQNGIKHYIILDCRKSNLEWIKNSILNSELNELFDLSKVNWTNCAEFANKNIVKEVCEYWNNNTYNETTSDLGRRFKVDKSTISTYLKKGNKLGWCNYNPKEEMKRIGYSHGKASSKKVEIFKNNKSLGVFESCTELSRQSEKLFGVKLLLSKISSVCNGKRKQHKGFIFKYVK